MWKSSTQKRPNITKQEKTHGGQWTIPTETKRKQDINEMLESLALIILLQPNHGKNNYNTSKDEREVNFERNRNTKQYTNECKGRYPKDNHSGRTSHRHTQMKRQKMNTVTA